MSRYIVCVGGEHRFSTPIQEQAVQGALECAKQQGHSVAVICVGSATDYHTRIFNPDGGES